MEYASCYMVPYVQATVAGYSWSFSDAIGSTPEEALANAHRLMAKSEVDALALTGIQGQ